ncbi:hypothetical protein IT072_01865 [Leifsonia sp. ZF2019]|uniref:hypothetical protein n=1 Tax=Leifsonia sp. ZF2019 TaxID=2781978 RepID=UPI001CC025D9|nr:hypothetical protein [Leifsonia sp. ZF2019]UAJ79850.1 hypothetical protein IT072_01865 [Leifsonia sp. ZF2019]
MSPSTDKPSADITASDAKPDEPEAARALDVAFDRQLRQSRVAHLRASRRAELVGRALADVDDRFVELTSAVGRLEAPLLVPREVRPSPGELHTMSLVTTNSSDRLFFATPPYDLTWTTFQPPGAAGTQAHGPSV